MKILGAAQIRVLEKATMNEAGITSLELMERAGEAFCNWFLDVYSPEDGPVHIFVGPGNNGGDGLVIARLLCKKFFEVQLFICHLSDTFSNEFNENFKLLPDKGAIDIIELKDGDDYPIFDEPGIIVDALLGIGISRPFSEYWLSLIHISEPTRPY